MMQALRFPGVWMWSAWQPDRGMCFNSYLLAGEDGCVAIDPLPLDEASVAQVESLGGIRRIVLTNRDHARASAQLRERFGARILAPAAEAALFDVPIDETFEPGREVVPGVVAIPLPNGKTPGEAALYLRAHRAAIVGDALIGAPAGSLSLLPEQKLRDAAALTLDLRELWALQLQALLLCDGQPLFTGADDAIGEFLQARDAAVNRINVDELRYEHDEPHPGYASDDGEVGLMIGARKIGYRVSRIPPGKAFCPLHSHVIAEEFFYVIEGTPTIRTLRGSIACRPGDFVAFPTGRSGTHQLRNDSQEDCLVLLVGADDVNEVCFYPDSQKVLVDSKEGSLMVRSAPALDYWEGE